MIIAILGEVVVEVDQSIAGNAEVRCLGRQNIGQGWKGGVGYVSTKWATVPASALSDVTLIDADCAEYITWKQAMEDTDRLADNRLPCAAAWESEDFALSMFTEYLHTHRLERVSSAREFTPNLPLSPAGYSSLVEGANEDVQNKMAVPGQSCTGLRR